VRLPPVVLLRLKTTNNVEIIQGDGQGSWNFNEAGSQLLEGDIVGTFSSGETRKLYKVPMAIFANVNGLVASVVTGHLTLAVNLVSFLLKEAGVGGAGRTLGGVLEASNVDTTEELLKVQELSNAIRANARVAAIDNENFKNILSELQ
jgi:flagellar hook protein FlgE